MHKRARLHDRITSPQSESCTGCRFVARLIEKSLYLEVIRKHWIYTVADFVDARKDRLLANGIDV